MSNARARRTANRYRILDAWDDSWDVLEVRSTGLGFDVFLGLPASALQLQGGSRQVIVTRELRDYMHGEEPKQSDLPLSRGAYYNLRRALGLLGTAKKGPWFNDPDNRTIMFDADLSDQQKCAALGVSVSNLRRMRTKIRAEEGTPARRTYEAFGEAKGFGEWVKDGRCVVGLVSVRNRVFRNGWSMEKAITTTSEEGVALRTAGHGFQHKPPEDLIV